MIQILFHWMNNFRNIARINDETAKYMRVF